MRHFFKSQLVMLLLGWFITISYVSLGGSVFSHYFKAFLCIFAWIPGLLAYSFAKKEKIKLSIFKLKWTDFFYFLALPILIVLLAALVSVPLCEVRSTESLKILLPLLLQSLPLSSMFLCFIIFWILMGTLLTAVFYWAVMLGPELMFRGYAWEKLKHLGLWRASFIIGTLWWFWAIPMTLTGMEYPGLHLYGIGMKLLYFVLMTPLMLYIRIQTKAVLAVACFYGFLMHISGIFPYLLQIPNGYYIGLQGIPGLATLGLVNLILYLKIRKRPLLEYEL